jgi:tRNA (guanine26-N2/guanine27-N2)-dimethyltransferase
MITEGRIKLDMAMPKKVSKDLDVFYNPVMKLNRDISIEVLTMAFKLMKRPLRVALPLAGSGIRGLRFLKEIPECVNELHMNDYMQEYDRKIKKLLKLNEIKTDTLQISNKHASQFLLESKGFDYIDIDPFGSPNPFLDAAVQRIARNGILAVTATDTSAFAGTYPRVTLRNYDAVPLRNWLKHDVGIRILIRKVQLVAAQYEKALVPIFSYSKDHYYRVFFRCKKSKDAATELVQQHKYLIYNKKTFQYRYDSQNTTNNDEVFAGKLWDGPLWEKPYVSIALIKEIPEEASTQGHLLDIHMYCKSQKLAIPNYTALQERLTKKGHSFARTHANPYCIKTTANIKEIHTIIEELQ